jgi:D-amino peptidase
MRIYISADIEGITGVCDWDETLKKTSDYPEFRDQMTAEVVAACEGALEAGASDILIKDAHDTGRNLIAARLPRQARLVRGWSGHPMCMVQDLDQSFSAAIMIGYHSRAGADSSPLAHTMATSVTEITINGRPASEFLLHGYAAAYLHVPVICVSGDDGVCKEVQDINPCITVVPVKEGSGNSVRSLHPDVAVERIRTAVRDALRADTARCLLTLPASVQVCIRYMNHTKAYRASFYPGARLREPGVVEFSSNDYFEVMRLLLFAV